MILTAATRLLMDGLNMRLVEQRGDEIDWACDRTRRRFTCTHAELALLIESGRASFQTLGRTPPRPTIDPEDVSPARRAEAERKLAYVLDLHEADLTHRAPLTEFAKRIAETASRLQDVDPPKTWTAKRWLQRAGEKPSWRAMLDDTEHKGNRTDRLTPDQTAIVDGVIDDRYLTRERRSLESLTPFVRDRINVENAGRKKPDHIPHVGRRAIAARIAMRDPRTVHAARHGELAARAKMDRVEKQPDPVAPLDRIEVDHTKADLFVVSDRDGLPIGRPTIGFAIDRCTRMPFGLYIGFEPESVLTVMQILKNGMFPKRYVDDRIANGEWDLKNDWPVWGMPRTLVFDRSMAALSHDIRLAALEIGIREVIQLPGKSGYMKGAVERFFRTQNDQLLHQQSGKTFSNIVQRDDYDPSANAVISFSDLVKMTHRWFIDIYARRPHYGLGKRTPAAVWAELIDRHPSEPVLPISKMVHLFTRSIQVTLGRHGARFKHIRYNSDELDAERLSADFAKASPRRRVRLRYDPADLGTVWIELPHRDGRYLRVAGSGAWAEYARGKSIWEHQQIVDHANLTAKSELDADALAAAHVALARDAELSGAKRRSVRSATSRARMDGVGRTSPHAADGATSPADSVSSRQERSSRSPAAANDVSRQPKRNGFPQAGTTGRAKRIPLAGGPRRPQR